MIDFLIWELLKKKEKANYLTRGYIPTFFTRSKKDKGNIIILIVKPLNITY